MKIVLDNFFKKTETIETTTVLIQSCAILLVIAGLVEIAFGIFLKKVIFPGIITALLGGIVYIAMLPSVGMVCFLWCTMPVLGAFTTRFNHSIMESLYSLFTVAPLIFGFRLFLSTRKLDKLRFPGPEETGSPPS